MPNWLGTDDQARDVVARLIYGFRISVLFGLVLTAVSAVVGVSAPARCRVISAAGWTCSFQRFIEIWAGLPTLFLLIILASVVEPNFWWLLGIMLLFSGWASSASCGRSSCGPQLRLCPRGARAGGRRPVIMFRHVLPNAMVATITFLPFILTGSITTLTSLDFLGFGLPPGRPRWASFWPRARPTCRRPGSASPAFFTSPSC